MSICELKNVTKSYGSGPAKVDALRGVSVSFDPGEFTVLSGPSGSGKTTALNMIGLLDTPTSGTVLVRGTDISTYSERELTAVRAKEIGFIFQSFNLIQVLTARENVVMALHLAGITDNANGRAEHMLESVGLGDLIHRRPNQLSGGQQQRVAIARAMVKEPALLIADEPTANLDSKVGAQVLDLMRALNEDSATTFLFSTHDHLVLERARRVVTIFDGAVKSDETFDGGAA